MRHFIFIAIAIFPMLVFAEPPKDQNYQDLKVESHSVYNFQAQLNDSQVADELRHLKYCLNKYRQDKLTGFWLTVGGSFTAALSVSLYQYDVIGQETAAIGYIAGGVSMVTGGVMQLISHRWLKKAYLGPTGSGIGLAINF